MRSGNPRLLTWLPLVPLALGVLLAVTSHDKFPSLGLVASIALMAWLPCELFRGIVVRKLEKGKEVK